MKYFWKYVFLLLCLNTYPIWSQLSDNLIDQISPTLDLPDGLFFGAGTSAFQIEGALKSHGRSKSFIELYLSHFKYPLRDSPEISSDSYHRYKEDVNILKYIGLQFYRFSISWPRLLPTGDPNNVNQEAVEYYNALLKELEISGIEPMVQLHHFDHPAVFEEFGGWQNESIIELFKNYAEVVFKEFGNRVKYFITFNESNVFCNLFDSGMFTDQENAKIQFPKTYICSHNVLKAHAEVYHLYHTQFNKDRKGMISINFLCNDYIVAKDDQELLDIGFEFSCGWFANPIFSKMGDYSDTLKQRVAESNRLRGLENYQLPTFSDSWIKRIRGTADFFALSYYSARVIEDAPSNDPKSWINPFIPPEARLTLLQSPNWITTPNGNYIVPEGLTTILKKVNLQYNNPSVYILENGYCDDGQLNDDNRIKFIYAHIKKIIEAINNHQCDVKAYIYWSLIDNYEFWSGYRSHFGLANVDFNSPNRTRTARKSATWLREVLRRRQLFIEN